MPQTTVLPVYRADYSILAKAQKPGGVTVSGVLIATAVPNKPTYVAGTIQEAEVVPEEEVTEVEEEPEPTAPRKGRRR